MPNILISLIKVTNEDKGNRRLEFTVNQKIKRITPRTPIAMLNKRNIKYIQDE